MPPGAKKTAKRYSKIIQTLIAETLAGISRHAAGTLKGLPYFTSPMVRATQMEFEFRGELTETDQEGIAALGGDISSSGAGHAVRVAFEVEHPPKGVPWELATASMVYDEGQRRRIYAAARKSIAVGEVDLGRAPVWRIGAEDYLVVVGGENPLASRVRFGPGGLRGEPIEATEALGLLSGLLSDKIERVLGIIQGD